MSYKGTDAFHTLCRLQLATNQLITKLTVRKDFILLYLGHERKDVGKIKSMTVNPCKKANETFGSFVSNSVGDPYVEPAKYHLRGNSTAEKPFVNMHGNRTVAKSEFIHMHNGKPKVVTPERAKGLHIK